MATQTSNAKAILERMKANKEAEKVNTPAAEFKEPKAAETEAAMPKEILSRICNYWSKAPNTEIALSNKPPIKFKGNAYQTSDSHEISVLDEMTIRIPNVFSKV